MRIESVTPIKIKLREGEVYLRPGQPVEVSNEDARQLIEKAHGHIRRTNRPAVRARRSNGKDGR